MTVWNEQTDERGRRGSVQKLEVDVKLGSSVPPMSATERPRQVNSCQPTFAGSTSELSPDTVLGLFAARTWGDLARARDFTEI